MLGIEFRCEARELHRPVKNLVVEHCKAMEWQSDDMHGEAMEQHCGDMLWQSRELTCAENHGNGEAWYRAASQRQ